MVCYLVLSSTENPHKIRVFARLSMVGNEVFDRIFGKELTKFRAKLCGEGFIVSENKCRSVHIRYDIRHGKSFARTRNTEQNLFVQAVFYAFGQFTYSIGLVARGLVGRYQFKLIHSEFPSVSKAKFQIIRNVFLRLK